MTQLLIILGYVAAGGAVAWLFARSNPRRF
jgi:hypothetical protein